MEHDPLARAESDVRESDEGAESDVHESDEGAESDAHESDEGAESEESDEDTESEASDSNAGVAVGKRKRGAVLKTFACPACDSQIELTELRTQEVPCGKCGMWVSHNWPENHGKVRKEVKRLRENHFKVVAYAACPDKEARKAEQKAKRKAANAKLTDEKRKKKRKDHNEYMKVWWAEHPEKHKANYDAGNEKKAKQAKVEREALAATLAVSCPVCGIPATDATDVLVKNRKTRRIVLCVSSTCPIYFSSEWPADINGTDSKEVVRALRSREESNAREEENRWKAERDREFEKAGKDPALIAAWNLKYNSGQRSRHFGKPCETCTNEHESREYDQCHKCREVQKRTKAYEMEVAAFFRGNELFYTSHDQKGPCNRKESNSRADFVFDDNDAPNLVIVEVDENQHRGNEIKCEVARMAKIRDQFAGRSIICIRYNPIRSSHHGDGTIALIALKSKQLLVDCLNHALHAPASMSVLGYELVFLGYDESRVVEFLKTELRMHEEQLGTFGLSSSSSSSSPANASSVGFNTIESLVQRSNDFAIRSLEVAKEEREKIKRQKAAARQAKHRANQKKQ